MTSFLLPGHRFNWLPVCPVLRQMSVPELAAGTVDIPAQYSPNTNIYSMFFKFIFECRDRRKFRLGLVCLFDSVHRNPVDMGTRSAGKAGKLLCFPVRIVHTADQTVLKGYPTSC